ncbi:hypothetical protein [Yersinia aleksiciae]|uniref:hypothetical protein n=1 Tax=Yersinia aleksiciae TaxID=263819 RepID=UPI00119D79B2|nr:hypothetical protein [Yersinia aleksiciae]
MHKQVNILTICIGALILSSCARATDKTLSPPSDTKWVNVEVQNPSRYTKPFPLEIIYISHKCMKERISGFDGSVIEEPSYNGIQIPLQQQGSSDIWHAKVAMTGGGSCDWTLSKLNLGIEYTDATHLRKDLVLGTAVGATIAFDSDASRNGKFSSVYGNLNLAPKYYPYIRERNLGKKENSLSLLGKENFLLLRAYDMNEIKYAPEIDEKNN